MSGSISLSEYLQPSQLGSEVDLGRELERVEEESERLDRYRKENEALEHYRLQKARKVLEQAVLDIEKESLPENKPLWLELVEARQKKKEVKAEIKKDRKGQGYFDGLEESSEEQSVKSMSSSFMLSYTTKWWAKKETKT